MKAYKNRIIIEKLHEEEIKSIDGFIIEVPRSHNTGRIVSIGENVEGLKEGDKILYSHYGGIDYSDKDGEYKILVEADILAILESEGKHE